MAFREFDKIRITDAASVHWLYTAHGSLDGVWTVAAVRGNELIVSRDDMLIRIRTSDARKVASYSIDAVVCASKIGSPYRGKIGKKGRGGQEERGGGGQRQ